MSYIYKKFLKSNLLQNKMYFSMLMPEHDYRGKGEIVVCSHLCMYRLTTDVAVMSMDALSATQIPQATLTLSNAILQNGKQLL